MIIRDWTSVVDVDSKFKVQDLDGNTLLVASSRAVADTVIKLVLVLEELQPALLDQIEIELNNEQE